MNMIPEVLLALEDMKTDMHYESFGDMIGDITYEAAGHTDTVLVSDEDLLEATIRIRDRKRIHE